MSNTDPKIAADARLSAVLESISDVYYALDRDWNMVMFNRSAEEFFGSSREAILGRNFWEIFPQGRGTEFGILLEAAMNGAPGRMTAPSALRDGRTVEVRMSPMGAEGVGVSINDVTERAEAERALRRSQRRLDLAVQAHQIGIFDWHIPTGEVVWTNEEERLFGLEPGTFGGNIGLWRQMVLPEDAARMDGEMAAAMAQQREQLDFEFRIQRADGAVRWVEGAARFLYGDDGAARRMIGTNVDVTERKVADRSQKLLINELNHRVKNTLAIVQGIAWQSLRRDLVPDGVRQAFEGRLAALAAAHDVLTQQSWESASIGEIIRVALAPHHAGDGRLTAEGPAIDLEPKTAVALGLAMHELATNAVKYGALSTPEGRVDVRWSVADGRLALTWRESDGPVVRSGSPRGFGARLLEQGLADELGGAARLHLRPDGVVWEVDAPLSEPQPSR